MPEVSRRAVLAAGGAVTTVLAAGPAASAASAASAAVARVPQRSAFDAVRGTRVRLTGPGGVVQAVVADVADLGSGTRADQQRYSVLLRPARSLPDGIYRISSSRLPRADLFLANVDRRRGAGLEAVVNTIGA